ncbi:MAG: insulinase family protein [Bdellovibrionaceae bacterium]|nr:insulinase family protein [Pseudobdellovibrionaceae bacterium]
MPSIKYKKTKLDSGATLVSEHHPTAQSFSVGFWVDVGSRYEDEKLSGITHFLEHIVFKGTKKRSAFDIAKSLEALGGDLNAFTSKEHTCFHGLVLKDDWKTAVDVLMDLVSNMKFSKKDFANEKNVIIQEIAMSEDQPDDIIYDYLLEPAYAGHYVGRPILGSIKTVYGFKEADVYKYYHENYQGSNLVISCAGNLNHDKIADFLNKNLKSRKVTDFTLRKGSERPIWHKSRTAKNKDTEQTHVLFALPATSFRDELRMEAFIVNSVLGGGMTSRLFQSVRETKGLAYSIQSQLHTMSDAGFITIQAACDGKKLKELVATTIRELKKLKTKGLTSKEVDFFKNQIKGAILLGSDDVENRMNSIAINELIFKKPKTVEDIQKMISKINVDSVREYIDNHMDIDLLSGALVGPNVESRNSWWVKS